MVNEIGLNEGMVILEEAFSKTRMILEGSPNIKFTPEEYQRFYEKRVLKMQGYFSADTSMVWKRASTHWYFRPWGTNTVRLCWQFEKLSMLSDFSNVLDQTLYESMRILPVFPSLENKDGPSLLAELVLKWSNYQVMARWLSRFFDYLNRFYIPRTGSVSLSEQAIRCFNGLVSARFNAKIISAATSLVNQSRNGEIIDWSLLRNVLEYFHITRRVGGTCYNDFQNALFADAAAYYSQIASNGLLYDSCADYMCKVQWYLEQEGERANQYLDLFSREKLLQVVKSQLLDQVFTKLAEKQQAENLGNSTGYQDLLSKCAGLNLGDRGSGETNVFMLDRT